MGRPSNFLPRPFNVGDEDPGPLGDGASYAHDVQPLEEELRLAEQHPEYGIDRPAVEEALREARADAERKS